MKITEQKLREIIKEELISIEEGITEASSNFKTLLGTSEDESIGRKIRLGGKRDPGQEVWQKVDKKNWMNLKTKKKLDLNKWAKHADEFHMSDKDLQFESNVNEGFSTWEIEFGKGIVSGVDYSKAGKVSVKARNTVEAIKKAVKEVGNAGDWMVVDVKSLTKK